MSDDVHQKTINRPSQSTALETLRNMEACADTWVPDARLLGSILAGDIANACRVAVLYCRADEYQQRYGMHVVPRQHGKVLYWRVRTINGNDPPYDFESEYMPTLHGWRSPAEAIVAYGVWLEQQEGGDAS